MRWQSAMRYLHAQLNQPEWMRHPMQEFLTASDAMHRAELHAWNLSREDVQLALFYIDGEIDDYRDRIADVDPVQWYELTTIDETSFYSYVCQEYTESDRTFFQAFADLSLVVIPPLVYDADGHTYVTVVGADDALTELVNALRDRADIGVEILEIGPYDR